MPGLMLPNASTIILFILTKIPFLNLVSTQVDNKNLQLAKMKQAVALLTRYDDYRVFCKTPDGYEHTRCKVSAANLFVNESGDQLAFSDFGRSVSWAGWCDLLMGKLIKIGAGTLSVDEFESYFIEKANATNLGSGLSARIVFK
jgi:tRNA pseudouridine38-40 synthase